MLDFISRVFGREEASKNTAKERLRLVLVHDRASVAPHLLEDLKEDLISVISKYMEIDEAGFEVDFDKHDSTTALVANIPVKRIKRKGSQD